MQERTTAIKHRHDKRRAVAQGIDSTRVINPTSEDERDGNAPRSLQQAP
jgi:hypothetical protein